MDVVMPGESGIEATRRILADVPATRVLVLSQSDDPADVREAFAAGASGYVLKDATNRELIDAVRTVASGSRYVNPALGARLAALASEKKSGAEAEGLSQREREILRLLARGHTNDDIAGMHLVGSTTAWFALVTPTDPPGRRSFTSPAQEAARDDRVRDLSFGSAGGFMYRGGRAG
jgi:two-component system response regulator NreC